VRHDHLNYRFKIIDKLGRGSFGQVIRAVDCKNGDTVAIKIIRNKKRFFQQALNEVRILEHIRKAVRAGTRAAAMVAQHIDRGQPWPGAPLE